MEENNEEVKNEELVMQVEENAVIENDGIEIAADVISVISGVAVNEVEGVASMSGGFAGGITEVLSGKRNLSKGIKVEKEEKNIKIDVNIIVEYGARIPEVAFEIQTRVKKAVEEMTDLKVLKVNVHVQGVNTDALKKDIESNEEVENSDNEENNEV